MAPPKSKRAETILVVDDNPEVLALATEILQADGYTVLSTTDSSLALVLAGNRVEPLHLLLTDVVIPLMSGSQLADKIRAIRPDVKILFMSGYRTEAVEEYRNRLIPRGLFLDKPFTVVWLKRTVRAALDSPTGVSWPRSR